MSEIAIRKAPGTWTVRSSGAVLGQTEAALEVSEGDAAPVIYFPRSDIAMALLDPTDKVESSERGEARFFTIVNRSADVENAAWSYEAPSEALVPVKDYIAFDTSGPVAVEQL